jgi:hypothetical protein
MILGQCRRAIQKPASLDPRFGLFPSLLLGVLPPGVLGRGPYLLPLDLGELGVLPLRGPAHPLIPDEPILETADRVTGPIAKPADVELIRCIALAALSDCITPAQLAVAFEALWGLNVLLLQSRSE